MVLIAGETHVIHDAVLDAGIHELVAANGALPLPVDCYPTPEDVPGMQRVHWASAGQALRATAAGAAAGDVYPLLLGAYGCGPNSMIEHLFADLVEDWPHAVLESDGHGGKAGYVTRVQAFLHSARAGRPCAAGARRPPTARPRSRDAPEGADLSARRRGGRRRAAAQDATGAGMQARLARLDRRLPHSLDAGYDRFYFGHVGGGLGRHLAAAMRGAGYDASYVGEPDAAALRAAGAACSGKECLPYQLIWGSFARFLDEEAARLDGKKALFLSAGNGFQACRANLFPLTEQISLERLGLGDRVEVADFSLVTGNVRMMPIVWIALVAVDLLNMLRFYSFADEAETGRERRVVRGVLGPARGDARAAPAGRRHRRQRGRGLPLLREVEELLGGGRPRRTGRCRATRRGRRACATSTSAATCTCAWTSGATTTCSASSPATACASSSSPTGRSSSCCSSARSRTAWRSRSAPRRKRRWRPCATSSAG